MRLRHKEALVRLGVVITSGFILSDILAYFTVPMLGSWAPDIICVVSSFFLGLFLVGGGGLLGEERSRGGGGLLIAFAIPILVAFVSNSVNFNSGWFVIGCAAGGLGAVFAIAKNRYDVLASTARLGYRLFAATIFIQIFVVAVLQFNSGTSGAALSGLEQTAVAVVATIILLGIMGHLVWRFVHGIRASNVFIFGPSKSGKTLLMLALYKEFVTNLRGTSKEVIIAENEEGMRIETLLSDLDGGVLPRSTRQSDLALYVFTGKKRGINPVSLTIIDYAGEYTSDIDEAKYREAIDAISDVAKVNADELEFDIGDPDYLQKLKNKSGILNVLDQVVLAYIYKNLRDAGKVLFLVDGDHLADFHKGGRKELTRICKHYSRMMDLCGADKKYGLVVTKTDKFYQLTDGEGMFKDSEEVEQDICNEWFSEIETFQEINNRALDMPIYFFTTSVFRTKQPIHESLSEGRAEQGSPKYIHPWRVDDVVEFGF